MIQYQIQITTVQTEGQRAEVLRDKIEIELEHMLCGLGFKVLLVMGRTILQNGVSMNGNVFCIVKGPTF